MQIKQQAIFYKADNSKSMNLTFSNILFFFAAKNLEAMNNG
jgi:hypothetical protein